MLRHLVSRALAVRGTTATGLIRQRQQCRAMGTNKTYSPNNLEKRFLVWSGKYKNVADIPAHISPEEMERSRNKIRIRLANIMMALTVVGCILMVYSGKQAAKKGDSVTKQNYDWHKKYNEENQSKPASN